MRQFLKLLQLGNIIDTADILFFVGFIYSLKNSLLSYKLEDDRNIIFHLYKIIELIKIVYFK